MLSTLPSPASTRYRYCHCYRCLFSRILHVVSYLPYPPQPLGHVFAVVVSPVGFYKCLTSLIAQTRHGNTSNQLRGLSKQRGVREREGEGGKSTERFKKHVSTFVWLSLWWISDIFFGSSKRGRVWGPGNV